ncbi:MAG: ATP-binding protein [Candidatus Accumulibacter sp.]|jgi:anti-sigma regulatory factor (Ser/Thr protein kinase)|nr:ATP-binding protein [Accumulibacter sp.]
MATHEHALAPETDDGHTILLPATPEHLSTIHDFLKREVPGEFTGTLSRIEMAVEELLMNIFHHAYETKGAGKAMISCRRVDLDGMAFFRVGVRDWGRPYNPLAEAPRPDLEAGIEERPIGGLGIHIVRTVTAHYCYSRSQDANELELFFARCPAER